MESQHFLGLHTNSRAAILDALTNTWNVSTRPAQSKIRCRRFSFIISFLPPSWSHLLDCRYWISGVAWLAGFQWRSHLDRLEHKFQENLSYTVSKSEAQTFPLGH